MPKSHKPTKVSLSVFTKDYVGQYTPSGNHHCPQSPTSAHQWRLETTGGDLSVGVCKCCGEHREFTVESALIVRRQ